MFFFIICINIFSVHINLYRKYKCETPHFSIQNNLQLILNLLLLFNHQLNILPNQYDYLFKKIFFTAYQYKKSFNMQSVNKIHVNSSTKLSLNDRFTTLATRPKSPGPNGRNNRSRSASRTRANSNKASLRNRKLLEQLDQKHLMRAALKIKRVIQTYTISYSTMRL